MLRSKAPTIFSTEIKFSCSHRDLEIIRNNLKGYNLKETCIQRILNSVANLPCQESVLGAMKFFTELQAAKSIREKYYARSPYFSEFFCTISNLGLFAVAYKDNDLITLFAATFSALSHAIPSERLHDLDLVGVFLVILKGLKGWEVFLEKSEVLWTGLAAGSLNILDTLITNRHLDKVGSCLHVLWHLAAAYAIYQFNHAKSALVSEGKDLDVSNATVFIAALTSTAALSAKGFLIPYLTKFTKTLNKSVQELKDSAAEVTYDLIMANSNRCVIL